LRRIETERINYDSIIKPFIRASEASEYKFRQQFLDDPDYLKFWVGTHKTAFADPIDYFPTIYPKNLQSVLEEMLSEHQSKCIDIQNKPEKNRVRSPKMAAGGKSCRTLS
jgi:hypothetical protein